MKTAQAFRLAIRAQGDYVNAYLAQNETLDGAILLGSLHRGVADADSAAFAQFKVQMQKALATTVKSVLGVAPEFDEGRPAPAHEREGHIPAANDAEIAISRALFDIGKTTELALRQAAGNKHVLYTLIAWGTAEGGDFLSYITNAQRKGVIEGLREMLGRFERAEEGPPVHERQ